MKKLLLISCACLLLLTGPCLADKPQKVKTVKDDPYLLLELFGAAFQSVRTDYVDETSDRDLIEAAINGMLTSLDPHSGFLNDESFNDMQVQTKGEFGGLGIEVTMENGLVRVVSPIDDTPAFKAGLQPGDLITHIDGTAVMGMTLTDAVDKMRGKPNSKIKLTIRRKNEEPFDVTMKRDIIKIESVKYRAENDIGYIRIITFSDTTTDHVQKAVKEMTKQIGKDKIKGFILDLRNNPGGLLEQAVGVTDTFLDEGEIVSTRSRIAEETMRLSATKGDLTNGLPVVVIINEGSASASEIVAGALQDHKRAVLVGTPSFGKGSVQSVKPIPGYGAIKLTTARYYTPSGRSIQAKGITPDVIIPRAEIKELPIIEGYSESNLPKALGQQEGEKNNQTAQEDKKQADSDSPSEPNEEKADYQLDRAMDILTSIAIYRQQAQKE